MMFSDKSFFFDIFPWHKNHPIQNVTMADGQSSLPIKGIGTIRWLINNKHPIEFHNVLYIPSLSTNLFSVKAFMHYQGCYFHTEGKTCTLAFPSFTTDGYIDQEFYVSLSPTKISPTFSSINATLHPAYLNSPISSSYPYPLRKMQTSPKILLPIPLNHNNTTPIELTSTSITPIDSTHKPNDNKGAYLTSTNTSPPSNLSSSVIATSSSLPTPLTPDNQPDSTPTSSSSPEDNQYSY